MHSDQETSPPANTSLAFRNPCGWPRDFGLDALRIEIRQLQRCISGVANSIRTRRRQFRLQLKSHETEGYESVLSRLCPRDRHNFSYFGLDNRFLFQSRPASPQLRPSAVLAMARAAFPIRLLEVSRFGTTALRVSNCVAGSEVNGMRIQGMDPGARRRLWRIAPLGRRRHRTAGGWSSPAGAPALAGFEMRKEQVIAVPGGRSEESKSASRRR
jgi:hypothetical protein